MPVIEHAEVLHIVRDAVVAHRPFSLIRLGDGEAIILGFPEFYSETRPMRLMRLFFGRHALPPEESQRLRPLLEVAISGADIVSQCLTPPDDLEQAREILLLPNDLTFEEKRRTQQLSDRMVPYLTGTLLSSNHYKTTKAIHIYMQTSGFFNDLIKALNDVTVITCNDVQPALRAFNPAIKVHHIHVPGEAGHEGERKDEWDTFAPHFPSVFEKVMSRLHGGGFAGPVLVGAGPLGKSYCHAIKGAGGVAIDIGSIMDAWAGRMTRSYMNSEQFKLAALVAP